MEIVIVLGLIGIVTYAIFAGISPQSSAPSLGENFACSGCGKAQQHSHRTITAWKNGARSFYCKQCHGQWRDQQANSAPATSGCAVFLPILVLPFFALLL